MPGGVPVGSFDEYAAFEVDSGTGEGTRWGAFTARHRCWADSTSLKTMARAPVLGPAPRVTLLRSRTVEKVDSTGFVVRRWIQCSAGKP
jgi:hypothetical protein